MLLVEVPCTAHGSETHLQVIHPQAWLFYDIVLERD